MLAGKPGASPPKASIDFIQHQQGPVLMGQAAEQRQESWRRNANASASLHGFRDDRANRMLGKELANCFFSRPKAWVAFRWTWIRHEISELPKLPRKWRPEQTTMRQIQRTVP